MTNNSPRTVTTGPLPLYAQVAGDLRAQIRKRQLVVGAELPGLAEICDDYGVSRITARQAIAQLVAEGLVTSARGQRAVVVRNDMDDSRPLFSVVEPNLDVAADHSIAILSRHIADELPLEGGFFGVPFGPYEVIRKLHSEGGAPYCLMDGYVAKALFDRFPKGAEHQQKLAKLVFDHADPPLTSGRERLLVAAADATEAAALDIHVGAPVARLLRIFCDRDGRVLYYGDFVYRGDRFGSERDLSSYVMERWKD